MREVDLLSVIEMKYVDHLCSVSSGRSFLPSLDLEHDVMASNASWKTYRD